MKLTKAIIATLLVASLFESSTLVAETKSSHTKITAISHVLNEQKALREGLLKRVDFKNSFDEVIKMDEEYARNPERLRAFFDHLELSINGEVIPVNESKTLIVRTDRTYTVRIKIKRGKIASFLTVIKASTQKIYTKIADLLTFSTSFDAPLHDYFMVNGAVDIGDVIAHHKEMLEMLTNPSDFKNKISQYLRWHEWLGLDLKLPDIKIPKMN